MSEKTAKEARKPNLVRQIKINCYDNGEIIVTNLPLQFGQSMQIMNSALMVTASHFVQRGRAGELNDQLEVEQSRIMKAQANDMKLIH